MAGILTPTWQKPPRGAMLDWSHPLSDGLVSAFLANENTGPSFDLCNRGRQFATAAWTATQGGLGAQAASASTTVAQPQLKTTSGVVRPLTVISSGRMDKIGSTNNQVWLAKYANTGQYIDLRQASGGTKPVVRYNNFTTTVTATGPSFVQGVVFTVAFTNGPAGLCLYFNGQLTDIFTAISATNTGTISSADIAAGAGGVTLPWTVYTYIYNYQLPATDIASLSANPYQMIAPLIPDAVFYSISAGGTTPLPLTTVPISGSSVFSGTESVRQDVTTTAVTSASVLTGAPTVLQDFTTTAISDSSTASGAPSVYQELSTVAIGSGSSLSGAESVTQDLTTTAVTASSTLGGTPAIAQDLTTTAIASSSALIGTPAVTQDLTTAAITASSALAGTETATQDLTTSGVASSSTLSGAESAYQDMATGPIATASTLVGTPSSGATPLDLTTTAIGASSALSGVPSVAQNLTTTAITAASNLSGLETAYQELLTVAAAASSALAGQPVATTIPLDLATTAISGSSTLAGIPAAFQDVTTAPAASSSALSGLAQACQDLLLTAITASSRLTGSYVTQNLPTPSERTFLVPSEDRTFAVPAENRTLIASS